MASLQTVIHPPKETALRKIDVASNASLCQEDRRHTSSVKRNEIFNDLALLDEGLRLRLLFMHGASHDNIDRVTSTIGWQISCCRIFRHRSSVVGNAD